MAARDEEYNFHKIFQQMIHLQLLLYPNDLRPEVHVHAKNHNQNFYLLTIGKRLEKQIY